MIEINKNKLYNFKKNNGETKQKLQIKYKIYKLWIRNKQVKTLRRISWNSLGLKRVF